MSQISKNEQSVWDGLLAKALELESVSAYQSIVKAAQKSGARLDDILIGCMRENKHEHFTWTLNEVGIDQKSLDKALYCQSSYPMPGALEALLTRGANPFAQGVEFLTWDAIDVAKAGEWGRLSAQSLYGKVNAFTHAIDNMHMRQESNTSKNYAIDGVEKLATYFSYTQKETAISDALKAYCQKEVLSNASSSDLEYGAFRLMYKMSVRTGVRRQVIPTPPIKKILEVLVPIIEAGVNLERPFFVGPSSECDAANCWAKESSSKLKTYCALDFLAPALLHVWSLDKAEKDLLAPLNPFIERVVKKWNKSGTLNFYVKHSGALLHSKDPLALSRELDAQGVSIHHGIDLDISSVLAAVTKEVGLLDASSSIRALRHMPRAGTYEGLSTKEWGQLFERQLNAVAKNVWTLVGSDNAQKRTHPIHEAYEIGSCLLSACQKEASSLGEKVGPQYATLVPELSDMLKVIKQFIEVQSENKKVDRDRAQGELEKLHLGFVSAWSQLEHFGALNSSSKRPMKV